MTNDMIGLLYVTSQTEFRVRNLPDEKQRLIELGLTVARFLGAYLFG